MRDPTTIARPSNTPGSVSTYTTLRSPVSITADSGTLMTAPVGIARGASLLRYLAGVALSLGGQPEQHTHTFRPSTSTASGSPMEPSFAFDTGQTFCSSTVMPACLTWAPGVGVAARRV